MGQLAIRTGGAIERQWCGGMDDDKIATALLADKDITQKEYAVWCDMQSRLFEGFELNRKHGVGTRRLQQIAKAVRELISSYRIRNFMLRTNDVTGHTVASGSKTRHAGDPTATHRLPDEESSWDVERMKAEGKLDRWSRKRR